VLLEDDSSNFSTCVLLRLEARVDRGVPLVVSRLLLFVSDLGVDFGLESEFEEVLFDLDSLLFDRALVFLPPAIHSLFGRFTYCCVLKRYEEK